MHRAGVRDTGAKHGKTHRICGGTLIRNVCACFEDVKSQLVNAEAEQLLILVKQY